MPSDEPKFCAWCRKPLFGEIARPDDRPGWCHDCSTTHGDIAVFQCVRCGKIVGGVKPGITDIGYVIKPNQVLHIDRCPECPGWTPDLDKSTCIEFERFLKEKTGGKDV